MRRKSIRLLSLALALLLGAGSVGVFAASGPVAENQELVTYRGVSVGGLLSAEDPDGGAVRFKLTTEPVKGAVDLKEDGHFIYTPADGKRGRDYFGFRAVDADGNESQEATVIIRIEKARTAVRYTDTAGLECGYAAQLLAEKDLLVGQCIAGRYVFEPERAITRGEFLALCMKAAGVETLRGVESTGYRDDAEIEAWLKPYVSTALLEGYADAGRAGDAATFDGEAVPDGNEAAVLLDRVFRVTNVKADVACLAEGGADWSAQAVANLSACGVLTDDRPALDTPLTRGEAALMLQRAMDIAAGR